MKRVGWFACVLAVGCLGAADQAWAGDDAVADGKYVLTVPAGETRTLTAEDVVAFAGRDLVKSGEGTLVGGDAMKTFTGDVYITNGVYRLVSDYGCGVNNVFIFGSGTLHVQNGSGSSWNNGAGDPSMALGGTLYFEGMGFEGRGAISNSVDCAMITRSAVMTGDALIASQYNNYFQFRYGSFDMGGHALTYRGVPRHSESAEFGFVSSKDIPLNPGDLDIYGGLEFQDWTSSGSSARTVTIRPGAVLIFRKMRAAQTSRLVLSDGAKLLVNGNESGEVGDVIGNNRWTGPVTLQGAVTNEIEAGLRAVFSGVVSGPGGFAGGKGGWLQLMNRGNTFTGGVGACGPATGDALSGGLAVFGDGCVPADGGAVTLSRSSLRLYEPDGWTMRHMTCALPALEATGPALVTNMTSRLGTNTVKSLTKTGPGVLTLATPVAILGTTDVRGGTLRFSGRVPATPGGLVWRQKFMGDTAGVDAVRAVDPAGVYYAYHAWPSGNALYGHYEIEFWYDGYIRVPGEPGAQVTCNFVSSIIREAKVVVGGTTVSHVKDNKDVLANTTIGYKRFSVNKPVTLTAGWQPISVYLHTWYDDARGPAANTEIGWVENFGLGVDWQGRCQTNSAHYVKLLDPGDGSFLRPSLATKDALDPAPYRPVFCGPVTFASGTVFDLGDNEPFTPAVFPSLTGLPTVTNGAVRVTDPVWTVRARDLRGGTPLTVAAGSRVTFAPDTVLVLDLEGEDERVLAGALPKPCPVIRLAAGGTLSNPPVLHRSPESLWRLVAAPGGGFDLLYNAGLSVIVR